MIREGIMIVGAEIVIDIMIVNVDMIGIVTEIPIGPAVMIQEAAAGHAHGQGNVPGIMIATGIFSLFFLQVFLVYYCPCLIKSGARGFSSFLLLLMYFGSDLHA